MRTALSYVSPRAPCPTNGSAYGTADLFTPSATTPRAPEPNPAIADGTCWEDLQRDPAHVANHTQYIYIYRYMCVRVNIYIYIHTGIIMYTYNGSLPVTSGLRAIALKTRGIIICGISSVFTGLSLQKRNPAAFVCIFGMN